MTEQTLKGSSKAVLRGYLHSGGGQLHYRVCGQNSQPLMLLLHQTPSSSAMYERLMPLLADAFYVVAVDTPGFGNSDPLAVPISIAALAQEIFEAVAASFGHPTLVFGHHTGASIAVQMAYDYPDAVGALGLSGPPLLNETQREQLPKAAAPIPLEDSGEHWLAMWARLRAKDSDAGLDLSVREALSAFACGEYYQGSYDAVVAHDMAGQLVSIDCPALVFAGDRDALQTAVMPAVNLLRKGTLGQLQGSAGTYVCDYHAREVADLLKTFYATRVRNQTTITAS